MHMTFRWFGPDDPIPLANIRQIPGVTGIVTALYDVAIGDVWPKSKLERLGEMIDRNGMQFSVVESIAVHEDIKLGRPSRDRLLDQYCESVRALARIDLSRGTGDLPGWSAAYDAKTLGELLAAYGQVDAERLWENLAYFLE